MTVTNGTAVGGDLTLTGDYRVATPDRRTFTVAGDARPTALVVGGRVDFGASSPTGLLSVLSQGYIKVGDLTGASVLNVDANNPVQLPHRDQDHPARQRGRHRRGRRFRPCARLDDDNSSNIEGNGIVGGVTTKTSTKSVHRSAARARIEVARHRHRRTAG